MAVKSASFSGLLTVIEALDILEGAGDDSITFSDFNLTKVYTSSTTPPVVEAYFAKLAMSAGAVTIDLEALPAADGTIDAVGLKLNLMLFFNPTGNSPITIKAGASNGYDIFGSAAGEITLNAQDLCLIKRHDSLQDVAAGDSEIDITGTGTEKLHLGLVLG